MGRGVGKGGISRVYVRRLIGKILAKRLWKWAAEIFGKGNVGVSTTRVSEAATAPDGPVFSSQFNDFVKSLNGSVVLLP